MKKLILALLLVGLPVMAQSSRLCGFISQENEGTWLEIPYADNHSSIEIVYTLEGEGVYELEQGAAVCVSFSEAPSKDKIIQVLKIEEWKQD
jgi:hypothetical protein